MPVETVAWKDGRLFIVDQTRLPTEYEVIALDTVEQVWEAIKQLKVRGAPAIGVAAALGVLVALRATDAEDRGGVAKAVRAAANYLASARPTAVNLFWALDRMRGVLGQYPHADGPELRAMLESEALAVLEEDKAICRAIGEAGAPLIREDVGILTHCNAGGLATADYGTALAVMFTAHERGTRFRVFADETRPLLQGARLTVWELQRAGIDVTLICDNMAGQVMKEGKIDLVITGADRIAANGDAANKIGTYSVAVLAQAHRIPFYVAAPTSTFDFGLTDGSQIPIEERAPEEITEGFGRRTAPYEAKVYNPAFDVTPKHLIHGFITEHGVLKPPYTDTFQKLRETAASA